MLVSSNYFYVDASQGAYFNGNLRARGGISNDGSNYNGEVRILETTQIDGDVRANTFYDRDNTGYYVNPSSDSHVNEIWIDDYLAHNGDGDTYLVFDNNRIRLFAGGAVKLTQIEERLSMKTQAPNRQVTLITSQTAVTM